MAEEEDSKLSDDSVQLADHLSGSNDESVAAEQTIGDGEEEKGGRIQLSHCPLPSVKLAQMQLAQSQLEREKNQTFACVHTKCG